MFFSGMITFFSLRHIPQYLDSPITAERLEYKASSGSYKATSYLLRLLQFTAIAVLDGDPLVDLAVSDMKAKLREQYIERCKPASAIDDPIAMAIKWAWPPVEEGTIVFDSEELMRAVEALCMLLCSVEPEIIICRLSEKYVSEECEACEFFGLGEAMKCLDAPREVLEKMVNSNAAKNHSDILRAYDSFDSA
jgi:hypothetical protein